jgi:hypothetical protein
MLSKISKKIEEAEKDNYLDLCNFELKELPEIPDTINKINYLFINDNLLTTVNFTIFQNLTVIDMSDNPIEIIDNLPDTIEELVCNNCKLTYICENKSLKKLHCQNNLLENISHYESLEDLRCDENKISCINSYPKLKKISCTNNPVSKIHMQEKLIVLDCSNTQMSGKIDFAPLLRNLICLESKISDVSNLSNIFEIEFDNSNISELPFLPSLKSVIFTNSNSNMRISPEYKIKKFLECYGKIDIVFE